MNLKALVPIEPPDSPSAAALAQFKFCRSAKSKTKTVRSTHQPEQMQPSVALFGMLHSLDNHGRLVKLPLLDALVDPDNVLPDDAPRTDIKVPVNISTGTSTDTRECVREQETYPTSELPISPSVSPTASPCAASVLEQYRSARSSMVVVSPARTAFPSSISDIPQPSWTLPQSPIDELACECQS